MPVIEVKNLILGGLKRYEGGLKSNLHKFWWNWALCFHLRFWACTDPNRPIVPAPFMCPHSSSLWWPNVKRTQERRNVAGFINFC